jgi:hypothetical protein
VPETSPFAHHRLVVGYHGCDRETVERVLVRGEPLEPSDNPYDWLGTGVYFWEHGFERALEFARWKQSRGEVEIPAVLGAYIHLGRCFDLTDTWATQQLGRYHDDLVQRLNAAKRPVPANRKAGPEDFDLVLRHLDCAVINYALTSMDRRSLGGGPFFQTIRGVFVEGPPAYPGAGFHIKSHVQVAVRDPGSILGYFLPAGGYDVGEVPG